MDLISKIAIRLTSNYVGEDEFGNKYYEGKNSVLGRKRRFVIYKGSAEPSKIPAEWHGWMHRNTDVAPVNINTHKHAWQKTHLPNLTGTKYSYFPSGSLKSTGQRVKVSSDYQAWSPNQNNN